jgi:hypothetical protein
MTDGIVMDARMQGRPGGWPKRKAAGWRKPLFLTFFAVRPRRAGLRSADRNSGKIIRMPLTNSAAWLCQRDLLSRRGLNRHQHRVHEAAWRRFLRR